MSPQHIETLLDLHEVMAQAIDMLRDDHESTPVARARALAYCCSVDAKLIEMATIDELQQPQQSEEQDRARRRVCRRRRRALRYQSGYA